MKPIHYHHSRYDNGKSACRVVPGVSAESVHKWRIPLNYSTALKTSTDGSGGFGKPVSRTALADPRSLNVSALRPCAFPCVLHFGERAGLIQKPPTSFSCRHGKDHPRINPLIPSCIHPPLLCSHMWLGMANGQIHHPRRLRRCMVLEAILNFKAYVTLMSNLKSERDGRGAVAYLGHMSGWCKVIC